MAIPKRQKRIISSVIVIAILFSNIFLNFLQPLENTVLNIINIPFIINNFFLDQIRLLLSYQIIAVNYKKIKQENEKLQSFQVQMQEVVQENERLNNLLQFKKSLNFSLVASRVIARDSYLGSQTVVINKGRKHNIKKDDAVITFAGLVGKVIEANDTTSKVMLISDPNLSVAVILQESRQQGLLQGSFYSVCKVRYLDADAQINKDEVVLTSGLGEIFPKGITVGKIISVSKEIGTDMQYAIVKPTVDLNKMEELFVVID